MIDICMGSIHGEYNVAVFCHVFAFVKRMCPYGARVPTHMLPSWQPGLGWAKMTNRLDDLKPGKVDVRRL